MVCIFKKFQSLRPKKNVQIWSVLFFWSESKNISAKNIGVKNIRVKLFHEIFFYFFFIVEESDSDSGSSSDSDSDEDETRTSSDDDSADKENAKPTIEDMGLNLSDDDSDSS